jgi:hypothetical protein
MKTIKIIKDYLVSEYSTNFTEFLCKIFKAGNKD